jgi:hypothetical protein
MIGRVLALVEMGQENRLLLFWPALLAERLAGLPARRLRRSRTRHRSNDRLP